MSKDTYLTKADSISKPRSLVMSDAKLFRLMIEHPNPVTRAVYRDMWFKRQQAKEVQS